MQALFYMEQKKKFLGVQNAREDSVFRPVQGGSKTTMEKGLHVSQGHERASVVDDPRGGRKSSPLKKSLERYQAV